MFKRLRDRGSMEHEPLPPRTALSDPELKAGLLREVDLFDGLSQDQLRELSRSLPMSTCRVGGLVTSPDDDDERLYIIKRGRVRLYRITPDGRQLTLDILDKGRIVGRMSWLGQQLNEIYAEAIEDALICSFTPDELQRLMSTLPGCRNQHRPLPVRASRRLRARARDPGLPIRGGAPGQQAPGAARSVRAGGRGRRRHRRAADAAGAGGHDRHVARDAGR